MAAVKHECACPVRRPLVNSNSRGTHCVMCGRLLPRLEVGCQKESIGLNCGCLDCGRAQVKRYAPRLAA